MTRYALAALVLVATVPAARADNLDAHLLAHIWEVKNFLEDNKVHGVGVLNFRVVKGDGKESFSLGTLGGSIPLRLETTLVLANNPAKPIGIIRDASKHAEKNKIRWFSKPADRKKLFEPVDYPLAWGKTTRADAMLTGMVKVAPDLASMTVTIEAILASNPAKTHEVCKFKVATDRELLRELGQSFAAPRGATLPKSRAERDKQAIANARKRDLEPGNDLSPEDIRGVKFEVYFDNELQTIRPDDRSPGEWRLDNPRAGQKIKFKASNVSSEKALGASIRVNGRSLWAQMQGEIDTSTGIWLLENDANPTTFEGFFTETAGQNLLPFRVLTDEESAARESEFGDRVGTIDIDVFASRPGGEAEVEGLSVSRGLSRLKKPDPSVKTSEDLRKKLLTANPILKKAAAAALNRGIIDADQIPVTGPEVKSGSLPDRKPIARLTIRYYDPKGDAALEISK